jgi:hypothetical protein
VWRQGRELEAARVHHQTLRTPMLRQQHASLAQQQTQQRVS